MKKVNLNFSIKDLDGNDMPENNMGKVVANTLVQSAKGDPIKFWGWALKLNNKEELEIDKSDFDTLKNFIKDHEGLTILLKGQFLESLEEQNK